MEPLAESDPDAIGSYRLVARLGAGGMGRVYLARSLSGRLLALKTILSVRADDPRFRARFRREVEAAKAVSGLFTAPVVAADPDAEPPWLATAYVPGPSLSAAVRRHGPLPVEASLALAAGLAEALLAVHAAGLVHRDLKPSNVLLAADGPRVIDFGIVHTLEHSRITAGIVGTPGYMSPEQAADGDGEPLGPVSDVFSLGATLYFAATGRPPFGTGSPAVVLYRVVHDTPDMGPVPPRLRDLVSRCMAKDPGERPSPREILALVGPALPGGHGWLGAPHDTMIEEYAPEPSPSPPAAETRPAPAPSDDPPRSPPIPQQRRRPPPPVPPGRWARAVRTAVLSLLALGLITTFAVQCVPRSGDENGRPGNARAPAGFRPWSAEVGVTRPLVANGLVYGRDTAYDALTGRVRWRYGGEVLGVVGSTLLLYRDGAVHAGDAVTGAQRWQKADDRWSCPPDRLAGGSIIAAYGYGKGDTQQEERLRGIDPASGRTLWSRSVDGDGCPTVTGGRAYVQTSRRLTSVDGESGRVWTESVRSDRSLRLLAADDTTAFVLDEPLTDVQQSSRHIRAFAAGTGEQRWSVPLDGLVGIVTFTSSALLVTHKASTLALAKKDGARLWQGSWTVGGTWTVGGRLPFPTGDIALTENKLIGVEAHDLAARRPLWDWEREPRPKVLAADRHVVAIRSSESNFLNLLEDDYLTVLDLRTGRQIWRRETAVDHAVLAAGVLYTVREGRLTAIEAATGAGS
ncbi:PQQ-binding-like beta-propeller repeat protein [Spirillospora sp. NPDC029432]|uniref:protein kinase domain-containing protein n=1 Tax=Spirillospora sp. NPDC029432 TaxID=3154599 RepID=UPI0034521F9E